MLILPAIDLYQGKAVRLLRGDYKQMTVYSTDPASVARGFAEAGATAIHIVDLFGAREGIIEDFGTVRAIADASGLEIEIGGGIRTLSAVRKYLSAGVKRVILGTAAIVQPDFVLDMVKRFGDAIAVSVDIKDGFVALKGWTELSDMTALDFCRMLQKIGVKTIICTDISKDGMLGGTNMELYRQLRENLTMNIIASGGVTRLDEIESLSKLGMYGAILGKALYTGDLKLTDALETAKKAAI